MSGVLSMTGFAIVNGDGFTLTAKSVNHRFLDLQIRVPSGSEEIEARVRTIVRAAVRRGHVEVSLELDRAAGSVLVRRNDFLLAELVKNFRDAAERHGVTGEPDLNGMLRVPGVMTTEVAARGVDAAAVEEAAATLMERFNDARSLEGASLSAGLRSGMDRLLIFAGEMAALREGVREAHVERLKARLAELLDGAGASEERVLTEAAMLAERSDVEEEIVRMQTHARRFRAMLDAGGEVGKALDFLLQEMNREANTMVSKVNGAMGERGLQLTDVGLRMKAEIERCKEQVQNLE